MINVKNITKIYDEKTNPFNALSDVSFDLDSSETVAVIGKSGSGKSTMMHIMSGLDHPTSGQIIIDGQELHKLKSRDMDKFRATQMSFIFQSFFIEANQTCFQNVMLPLEIAKVPKSKRQKLVADALSAVGLEDKINKPASNLSGVQKQRLAIARAIVGKPKLIFADEPTGNLDSVTGDKIIELLFSLNKKLKCTLVVVTHDDELAVLCDKQIKLKDGKVESIAKNKAGKK